MKFWSKKSNPILKFWTDRLSAQNKWRIFLLYLKKYLKLVNNYIIGICFISTEHYISEKTQKFEKFVYC